MTPPLATADPDLLDHEGHLPARSGDGRRGPAPGRRGRAPEAAGGPGRRARRLWLAALAGAVAWSALRSAPPSGEVVNEGGWVLVRRFLGAALRPELGADFLAVTAEAALTTLAYAVLGTALSVALGLVLGVLSSETWWRGGRGGRGAGRGRWRRASGGWLLARAGLSLPRGVHEAVWGLMLVRVLGLDPLVAVLAIAIPYGAVTAKVYAEVLDDTPARGFAAVRAAGARRVPALLYTLGPQALPDMLSYAFYRFECSLRAAAVLGVVGAGGLGFELALSFQSLRYGEMWTLVYALMALSGLADWWSTRLRRRTAEGRVGREATVGAGRGRHDRRGRRWSGRPALWAMRRCCTARSWLKAFRREATDQGRDRFLVGSALAGALLVGLSVWHLRPDPATLWSGRTADRLAIVAAASWPPRIDATSAAELARLALETVEMSVVAIAVAGVGAAALALALGMGSGLPAAGGTGGRGGPGARRHPLARVSAPAARGVLLACRAVPPPVWALLLLFVLFPGPLPGALALGAYNFGILGRLMAEVVEHLDDRPARALRAQGAGPGQVVLYATAPAAMPRFVSYGVYRWEVTIRETVIVGLVGAGGLGRLLSAQLTAFDYRGVSATLLALVTLTFAADLVGGALRRLVR